MKTKGEILDLAKKGKLLKDPEVLAATGAAYLRDKNADKALLFLNAALKYDPDNVLYKELFKEAVNLGDAQKA